MTGQFISRALRRDNQGFTLIELMITVIVLGILSAAAFPLYRSFITSQSIKTASFDMIALITFTRSEAIKRNTQVTLNSNGATFNTGSAYLVTAAGATLRQQTMFTGVQLDCINMAVSPHVAYTCPGPVIYNASGRLQSGFGAIEIHAPNVATDPAAPYRCISIDLSGRPISKKGRC